MYDILYTIYIDNKEYIFEWDLAKEEINIKKHGVSFNDAALRLLDRNAIEYFDIMHSTYEQIVLIVIYTIRENRIRIISARKATKDEEAKYYGENS